MSISLPAEPCEASDAGYGVCARCYYDLSGLPDEGRCPECNWPIGLSRSDRPLTDAPSRVLRPLILWTGVVLLTLLLRVACAVLYLVARAAPPEMGFGAMARPLAHTFLALCIGAQIAWTLLAFGRAASTDPTSRRNRPLLVCSSIALIACVGAVWFGVRPGMANIFTAGALGWLVMMPLHFTAAITRIHLFAEQMGSIPTAKRAQEVAAFLGILWLVWMVGMMGAAALHATLSRDFGPGFVTLACAWFPVLAGIVWTRLMASVTIALVRTYHQALPA